MTNGSSIPANAYTPEISRKVYQKISERALAILALGVPVIADATFRAPVEREQIEQLVQTQKIPFHGFWLKFPDEVAYKRLQNRSNNVSDADATVYKYQQSQDVGAMTWIEINMMQPTPEVARLIHERYLTGD